MDKINMQALIDENARLRDDKRRLTAEVEEYLYATTAKANMFDVLLSKGIISLKEVSDHLNELDKRESYELRKLWKKEGNKWLKEECSAEK